MPHFPILKSMIAPKNGPAFICRSTFRVSWIYPLAYFRATFFSPETSGRLSRKAEGLAL